MSMLDPHRFLTGLRVAQLPNVFLNPYVAENPVVLQALPQVRKFAERRELVQRLMKTQAKKRKNVAAYRTYIHETITGRRPGSMPPIEGWTPEKIEVVGGTAYLPWGEQLVAFDSDTQLCAWFDLLQSDDEQVLNYVVPVVIHSARSTEWAQQQLHDRNTYGVKMSSSEALERDSYDPVTALTRRVIDATGLRVATNARQLGAKDPEQVTLSALRQGVLTTVAGRPGIQLGSKPYELPTSVGEEELTAAVTKVWARIAKVIEPYLDAVGRKTTVLPAPSIMAGIGVLANACMPDGIRRDDVSALSVVEVVERLQSVRWDRVVPTPNGPQYPWDGIAGKANHALGRFAVGGAKEFAYNVSDALLNPDSHRGRQVRTKGASPHDNANTKAGSSR
ncbi:DNA sulfur modification protein DndB [Actinoplanes sp. NPDC051861]|uniref:DNA sulfur modification protein DndB n=1 Tax=Actinoplanes sp. NPDC051861 TaxID=3155170 RepID=UPI003435CCC5